MRYYPAVILAYAGGVAAIARQDYACFADLLFGSKLRDGIHSEEEFGTGTGAYHVLRPDAASRLPGLGVRFPINARIYSVLREPLREYLPDSVDYLRCFDRFEYMWSLLRFQACLPPESSPYRYTPGEYLGRPSHSNPMNIVNEELITQNDTRSIWLPFRAGLFRASPKQVRGLAERTGSNPHAVSHWATDHLAFFPVLKECHDREIQKLKF